MGRYNLVMNLQDLGQRLKKHRDNKGLSQAQLADRLGWTSGGSRISNYERGYREPSLSDLEQIARALDTTLVTLLIDPDSLPEGVTAEQLGLVIATLANSDNKRFLMDLLKISGA